MTGMTERIGLTERAVRTERSGRAWRRTSASTVAAITGVTAITAVTAVLGGLLTTPAMAEPPPAAGDSGAAGAAGEDGEDGEGSRGEGDEVTLPTGERVSVDADGRVIGTRPAAGRADVPLHTLRTPAGSYVVPADAVPSLAAGELVPGLFEVSGAADGGTSADPADAAGPADAADPEDGAWHEVTIEHLDRNGNAAGEYVTFLQGTGELAWEEPHFPYDESGTVTLRVPAGSYVLTSTLFGEEGQDVLTRPVLEIDGDTTVTLDARVAEPVEFTVPDPAAEERFAAVGFTLDRGPDDFLSFSSPVDPDGLRIAHLGPEVTDGELSQELGSAWTVPDGGADYHLGYRVTGTALPTGYTRHVARGELAEVTAGLGASLPGKRGALYATAHLSPYTASSFGFTTDELPLERTVFLAGGAPDGEVPWSFTFDQTGADPYDTETVHRGDPAPRPAGSRGRETFNVGVFGPLTDGPAGLYRSGNHLYGSLPLLADGAGRPGESVYDTAEVRLYRDGEPVFVDDAPLGNVFLTLPPERGEYLLTAKVRRSGVAAVSTEVTGSWTFTSGETTAATRLPLAAVHVEPRLDLASSARAGAAQRIPVTVRGAEGAVESLELAVSYDDGASWRPVPVVGGRMLVRNPAHGAGLTLRAEVTDTAGNTAVQEIHNAYLGA